MGLIVWQLEFGEQRPSEFALQGISAISQIKLRVGSDLLFGISLALSSFSWCRKGYSDYVRIDGLAVSSSS